MRSPCITAPSPPEKSPPSMTRVSWKVRGLFPALHFGLRPGQRKRGERHHPDRGRFSADHKCFLQRPAGAVCGSVRQPVGCLSAFRRHHRPDQGVRLHRRGGDHPQFHGCGRAGLCARPPACWVGGRRTAMPMMCWGWTTARCKMAPPSPPDSRGRRSASMAPIVMCPWGISVPARLGRLKPGSILPPFRRAFVSSPAAKTDARIGALAWWTASLGCRASHFRLHAIHPGFPAGCGGQLVPCRRHL